MTREDFIFNLANKFRSKNDEENKIFHSDLDTFLNACKPDICQDLYNHVTQTHNYQTIPRMAMFWKYAKQNNLLKEKEKESIIWWYKCQDCQTEYSKEGRGCPKCRSPKVIVKTGESAPNNMIQVHEDCHYCTIYPEAVKVANNKKVYGVTCSQYGTINNQDRMCGACECLECCKQMNAYNVDHKNTIEKYRTTEFAQPWLMECEKLSETAQAMLNNIANR